MDDKKWHLPDWTPPWKEKEFEASKESFEEWDNAWEGACGYIRQDFFTYCVNGELTRDSLLQRAKDYLSDLPGPWDRVAKEKILGGLAWRALEVESEKRKNFRGEPSWVRDLVGDVATAMQREKGLKKKVTTPGEATLYEAVAELFRRQKIFITPAQVQEWVDRKTPRSR